MGISTKTDKNTIETLNFLPAQCIIISREKISINEDYRQFSPVQFCEYLLRKSPLLSIPMTLSKKVGTFILRSIIQETFKENYSLLKLAESKSFCLELFVLFERFMQCEFTYNDLSALLKTCDLEDEDKTRLDIIINTYKSYLEKIKELNYLDTTSLFNFTVKTLLSNEPYLLQIKEKFQNIIINNQEDYPPKALELFQTLGKIVSVPFKNYKENNFSTALLSKYTNSKSDFTPEKQNNRILVFEDLRDEVSFIASEIIELIKSEQAQPKDFLLVPASKSYTNLINEIFSMLNIPTTINKENNEFKNFKIKLIQYLNICEGLRTANIENISKSRLENIYNEINLNFENIICETLENQFIKDKFITLFENSTEISLINYVKNNLKLVTVAEAKKLQEEIVKLEKLFELFKKNNFVEICMTCTPNLLNQSENFKFNFSALIKNINTLNASTKMLSKTIKYTDIIDLIHTATQQEENQRENCIKISTLNSAKNFTAKKVYIIGLSEKTFPQQEKNIEYVSQKSIQEFSKKLNILNNNFGNFYETEKEVLAKYAQDCALAISTASDFTTLSTHKYEDKKQIAPSLFFQYLASIFTPEEITLNLTNKNSINNQNIEFSKEKIENETVISDNDVLVLNPTAINNFLKCPRKFYFSNLLNLKEKSTFAASYGSILHSIMENFNNNYLDNYTKSKLTELTELLFASGENPAAALDCGYKERDINLVNATNLLALEEMKTKCLNAIDEMEKKGFFREIPIKIITEKPFTFELKELPNVVFDGRIDAIYQYPNTCKLTDYKTGKTNNLLEYYFSQNGVEFKSPKGASGSIEKNKTSYQYQIPIYYLACQNSESFKEFKDKIEIYERLFLRPKGREDGYLSDSITAKTIENYINHIIKNLKETVIDKIRNCEYYAPTEDTMICENCGYKDLCTGNREESNE